LSAQLLTSPRIDAGIRRSLADAFFINKDKQTAAIIEQTYAGQSPIGYSSLTFSSSQKKKRPIKKNEQTYEGQSPRRRMHIYMGGGCIYIS
jgi:hypothetical protein